MANEHEDLVARAEAAAKVVAPLAGQIEAERKLPEQAVKALVEARVFKLAVPRAIGGCEAKITTLIDVIETIARADGSAGWCAMIGATSGLMSVFVDADAAREMFGPHDAIAAGVTAPLGKAQRTADGYRVTGRWPFASGCEHAGWRMGGAILSDEPPAANGAPAMRCFIFRADQTRVIDTWHTSGLRGTGSHDLEVSDALVPTARSFSLFDPRRGDHAGVCAAPFFGLLATAVAAVAIGIARGALDAFLELATDETSARLEANDRAPRARPARCRSDRREDPRRPRAPRRRRRRRRARERVRQPGVTPRPRRPPRRRRPGDQRSCERRRPGLQRRGRHRDLPKEPASKALSRRARRHPARDGRAVRRCPRRPRAPRGGERHLDALSVATHVRLPQDTAVQVAVSAGT